MIQQHKGKVAVIVDNKPWEDVSEVEMIDDMAGRKIHIPTVMISRADGEKILNHLQNEDSSVSLTVDFKYTKKEDKVKVKFYGSSDVVDFYNLLQSFKHDFEVLGEIFELEPIYRSYEHFFISKNQSKTENCLGAGRYCADPNLGLSIGDGRHILLEDLRQKCIWKVFGQVDFLRYVIAFYEQCFQVGIGNYDKFRGYCSDKVMEKLDIDANKVQTCLEGAMEDTEDYEEDILLKENAILKADKEKAAKSGISFFPALAVNGVEFRGSWTAENLLEVVCASFLKYPPICADLIKSISEEHETYYFFSFAVAFAVLFNLVIVYFCVARLRKRISERLENPDFGSQVNHVVTNYRKL